MENEEQETTVAAPKPRRGRLIAIIVVVALLALGGGGFALFAPHGKAKVGKAKVASHESGPEQFLALDPAFVVNFRDDQAVRYLQVGVSLMSHDSAAIDAAKQAQPVIRNALVMLFSGQNYASLIDAAGKQKLQAQALAAVQKIVDKRIGRPGIDALYFTSFVMQ